MTAAVRRVWRAPSVDTGGAGWVGDQRRPRRPTRHWDHIVTAAEAASRGETLNPRAVLCATDGCDNIAGKDGTCKTCRDRSYRAAQRATRVET